MNTETNFMSFEDLTKLIEEHKKETHPYKKYEFDSTSYTLLLISINNLIKENKKLNGAIHTYDILLKANVEENKQLKNLIDIILNFSFFKEECPLNFGFENNTNEDKSQSVFYEDEWCEDNCNDNYKDCWLKYFKKLQELEGSDSNENN